MTAEQLRLTREASSFLPFTIQLADGQSYYIPHRDFVSQHPNGSIIVVYNPDGSASIVDMYLVTELKVQPQPH